MFLFNLGMPSAARRLSLIADVLGRVLVKGRFAHLVAEIVSFASVFRPVLGRLLVHFHPANRIFRQISTSSRIIALPFLLFEHVCKHILHGLAQGNDESPTSQTSSRQQTPASNALHNPSLSLPQRSVSPRGTAVKCIVN